MTSINEKLGIKRAGKRSMMKLPADRALRTILTSAECPGCNRRGAQLSKIKDGMLFCTYCYTNWPIPSLP